MKHTTNKKLNRLARVSLVNLLAIYVLILVGGIVRSTGSGMGCPDWPKCFGNWVPPTAVEQLPADYLETYGAKRMQKNEKFAKYLKALGFEEKAELLLTDQSIQEETPFNVYKTWVEYINRLVGAIIGLLSILTVIAAFPHRKQYKHVFYLAVGSLLLVIFQGWLGSIVVSTNLVPWMVTVHMIPALVIVVMLIYLVFKSKLPESGLRLSSENAKINLLLGVCIVLMFIQIILGTQVREAIDVIAAQLGDAQRDSWINNLGLEFIVHRSFSWMIVISHGVLLYLIMKREEVRFNTIYGGLVATVLLNVGSGVVMAYLGIPAFVQPLHLLLAIILFGLLFAVFFLRNMRLQSIENGN